MAEENGSREVVARKRSVALLEVTSLAISNLQKVNHSVTVYERQEFNNDANPSTSESNGMFQEVATSTYTFANAASHVPELLSNESLTLPQPLVPHQAEPVPVQTPALGLPQDLYSNKFQNISFTNLGFSVPTNPTPVNPPNIATPHSTSATLVFHLQAIARSMGFVLVPIPMPGAGT